MPNILNHKKQPYKYIKYKTNPTLWEPLSPCFSLSFFEKKEKENTLAAMMFLSFLFSPFCEIEAGMTPEATSLEPSPAPPPSPPPPIIKVLGSATPTPSPPTLHAPSLRTYHAAKLDDFAAG